MTPSTTRTTTWGRGIVEVFGGIASRGARYLRFLARRASDRKRGRDGTAYSDYHASGGFLAHHLARISMAAVYWDAQHIDEHRRALRDAKRIVPQQNDRCVANVDIWVFGREMSHQVNIVGYKRISIEMMFGRPETVEVGIGAQFSKPKLLLPHLLI